MQHRVRGGKNKETSNKPIDREKSCGLTEIVHTNSLSVNMCVCTFRSLLSRCSSSEPRMSCRLKMSLYSPRLICSSQMPTSSVLHLSTTHTHTTQQHTQNRAEGGSERLWGPAPNATFHTGGSTSPMGITQGIRLWGNGGKRKQVQQLAEEEEGITQKLCDQESFMQFTETQWRQAQQGGSLRQPLEVLAHSTPVQISIDGWRFHNSIPGHV